MEDIRNEVKQAIESINIYKSELEGERQNVVNYCLAISFYLGCFELYKNELIIDSKTDEITFSNV